MILLLLLSCIGNKPPLIREINGIEVYQSLFGQQWIKQDIGFDPTKDLKITLDVIDTEGDEFEIWWPEAPLGWDFPYDGTEGVWYIPDDIINTYFFMTVIAIDEHDDANTLSFGLYMM